MFTLHWCFRCCAIDCRLLFRNQVKTCIRLVLCSLHFLAGFRFCDIPVRCPISILDCTAIIFRRYLRSFKDTVFDPAYFPVFKPFLMTCQIAGLLQFPDRSNHGIPSFFRDLQKPVDAVVPFIRKAEEHREKSLCLQAEPPVPQMIVAHGRIVRIAFHTENSHFIYRLSIRSSCVREACS